MKRLLLYKKLLFLFVLVLFPSMAFAELSEIRIKGNQRIEVDTIKRGVHLQPGMKVTPLEVRKAIEEIYTMGYFDNVSADLQTDDITGNETLTFTVKERLFITRIEIKGNSKVTKDDLKAELTLIEKSFLNMKDVEENKNRLIDLYLDKGYYNVKIYPLIDKRTDKKTEEHLSLAYDAEKAEDITLDPKVEKAVTEEESSKTNRVKDTRTTAKGFIDTIPAPSFTETSKVKDNELAIVTFMILEGEKSYIKSITFKGNKNVSDKKLNSTIETSKKHWFKSIFTSAGLYKKDQVAQDLEKMKSYYLNNGFLDVSIDTPEVELGANKKWFDLTFNIAEGEQFKVGKVGINGNVVFPEEELKSGLSIQTGELVNRSKIQTDIAKLTDGYGKKGYLFANVVPIITPDKEKKIADITYEIAEDALVYLRKINIVGNDKTREKVIRREMRIDEQDKVDTTNLRRSYQRINNLNFFESVDMVPRRVGDNMVDIDIKVKEKSTGTFSIGGGYSSVDRAMAIASISEGNFGGRGQLLRFNSEVGSRRKSYSITFREPYLFDKPISGMIDIYNESREFDTYTENSKGGALTLSKSFTEYVRSSISYSRKKIKLSKVDTINAPTTVLSEEARGETTTASMGHGLVIDKRDNPFNAHSGYKASYSMELAEKYLGGEAQYFKAVIDASKFIPLWFGNIFSTHLNIGKVWSINSSTIPISEKYYIGGINTIRGFDFGRAGPVDTTKDEIKGADKKLIINFEYIIPLIAENNFQWVFFYDIGKGFDEGENIDVTELRRSFGTGIRFITPVGAIRLEWARIVNQKPEDRAQLMEFTIGSIF